MNIFSKGGYVAELFAGIVELNHFIFIGLDLLLPSQILPPSTFSAKLCCPCVYILYLQDSSSMEEVELASDSRLEQGLTSNMDQPSSNKTKSVSFFGLFAAADTFDYVLMFLGSVGACVHGAALPVFFILFGRMIDSLGHLANHPHKLYSRISEVHTIYPHKLQSLF